jgi:Asp-tRNA(Asn)/Glu-tRNA(Gln) amidotransferase A subunit family amidase
LIWTLTHLAVIHAPTFRSPRGLPFGLQITARRYNDRRLFKFCDYLRSLDMIPEGSNPRIRI